MISAKLRRFRERNKANGWCSYCKTPKRAGYSMCARHILEVRERTRLAKRAKRAQLAEAK